MKPKKVITEHGMSMYRQRKCRCDICKQAAADQRKKFRKPKPAQPPTLDGQPLLDRLERDRKLFDVQTQVRERWRTQGISLYLADYWCIKLGYHPVQIWGQAFYQDITTEESIDA